MSRFRAAGASAALAAALAAVAFIAKGAVRVDRAVLVSTLLVIVGGAIVALAVARGRGGRLNGAAAIVAFGAYTAVIAVSVTWSIAPDLTLIDTSRMISYLAVFAAAVVAANAWRGSTEIAAYGILVAATVICGWALITRVFPADLAEQVFAPRLSAPFDYWNSLASVATIGIPPALWVATREQAAPAARALALPALGVLGLTLALTQSRGGIIATVLVLAVWFAVVPLRLRSLAVGASVAVAVLPVALWALSKNAFTDPVQPLAAREAVAGDFGLLVALLVVGLFAAGLAIERLSQRAPLSLRLRWRVGVVAIAVAALVPLAGLTAVAASDNSLRHSVSRSIDELTSGKKSAPPKGASRLTSTSSARGAYWNEALDVFADRPFKGSGAGSFEVARLEHRQDTAIVRRAHSFVFQTVADTGVLGALAALALLAAWLLAAARTLSVRRPRGAAAGPGWPDERVALTALGLAVLAFGVESSIDLVWSIPAPAVMALTAAGVVAGRGPLPALGTFTGPEPPRAPRVERAVWAAAITLTALICAWTVWQPGRADRAVDRSTAALNRGDTKAALEAAADARSIESQSLAALFARADALDEARRLPAELVTLRTAVSEHPRNPEAWSRLGYFEAEELAGEAGVRRIAKIVDELDPRRGIGSVLNGLANENYEKRVAK